MTDGCGDRHTAACGEHCGLQTWDQQNIMIVVVIVIISIFAVLCLTNVETDTLPPIEKYCWLRAQDVQNVLIVIVVIDVGISIFMTV